MIRVSKSHLRHILPPPKRTTAKIIKETPLIRIIPHVARTRPEPSMSDKGTALILGRMRVDRRTGSFLSTHELMDSKTGRNHSYHHATSYNGGGGEGEVVRVDGESGL
ncbi:hypothetical protein Pcinc_037437 [Petrolisthes cinctipes]|uniref:Uncharacterized protein n=1 Tax=Petrolisthes cinctipes TaxID=88211 RepID=A0AAE1BSJ0_PETCI|nr:hypothetical protein Pcinc_037437 [Petrolisthes cinctipes]